MKKKRTRQPKHNSTPQPAQTRVETRSQARERNLKQLLPSPPPQQAQQQQQQHPPPLNSSAEFPPQQPPHLPQEQHQPRLQRQPLLPQELPQPPPEQPRLLLQQQPLMLPEQLPQWQLPQPQLQQQQLPLLPPQLPQPQLQQQQHPLLPHQLPQPTLQQEQQPLLPQEQQPLLPQQQQPLLPQELLDSLVPQQPPQLQHQPPPPDNKFDVNNCTEALYQEMSELHSRLHRQQIIIDESERTIAQLKQQVSRRSDRPGATDSLIPQPAPRWRPTRCQSRNAKRQQQQKQQWQQHQRWQQRSQNVPRWAKRLKQSLRDAIVNAVKAALSNDYCTSTSSIAPSTTWTSRPMYDTAMAPMHMAPAPYDPSMGPIPPVAYGPSMVVSTIYTPYWSSGYF